MPNVGTWWCYMCVQMSHQFWSDKAANCAWHSEQSLQTLSICSAITSDCLWKPARHHLCMRYPETVSRWRFSSDVIERVLKIFDIDLYLSSYNGSWSRWVNDADWTWAHVFAVKVTRCSRDFLMTAGCPKPKKCRRTAHHWNRVTALQKQRDDNCFYSMAWLDPH